MEEKKIVILFQSATYRIALAFIVLLILCFAAVSSQATCKNGIEGNGTGGINIDINSDLYNVTWGRKNWAAPYLPGGCTWFVGARVSELTNNPKNTTIWSGPNWWNSYGESLGYTKGTALSLQYKAVVCWGPATNNDSPHVAIIEDITEDGKIILSEGGKTGPKGNENMYTPWGCCQIIKTTENELRNRSGKSFLGYIYLDVELPHAKIPKDVVSGVYVIHSARKNSLVFNIEGNSTANNANIELLTENNSDVQRFRIIKWDENWYCIQSIYSGRWLDIQAPFGNNANVKLYGNNDGDENHWRFFDAGNGYVYIQSKRGNLLDITYDQEVDHANVQVYEFTDGLSEKWKLEDITDYAAIEDGTYKIQTALNTNYCLDIENDSTNVNANIILMQTRDSAAQLFRLSNTGSYYTVQSVHNNLWLDIARPFANRANVKLFGSNKDPENHWRFENAGDGNYYICSDRGFYLDIEHDTVADGSNIQTFRFSGSQTSNIQKWRLAKTAYTITYDANGGENAPEAQTKILNSTLTLSSAVPARPGYDFLYWNTAPDGSGTSYAPGDAFTLDADTILYAIWSDGEITEITGPESITITVGGKEKLEIMTKPAGADLSTLSYAFSDPACATIDSEHYIHAWYQPGKYSTVLTITAPNGVSTTIPVNFRSNILSDWEVYINNQPINDEITIDVYKVGQTVPYHVEYEVTNGYDPGYDLSINEEYSYPLAINKNNQAITFTGATTLVPGLDNSMVFDFSGSYFSYGTILITDDQQSMYLPENLQFIEDEAFYGSEARYFFLPDGIKGIGNNAFPAGSTVFLKTANLLDYGFQCDDIVFVENGTSYNEAFASVHGNYFARRGSKLPEVWSDWSEWSESAITESETRRVRTKTQYRSAAITQQTGLTDWSNWSDWSLDSQSIPDDNLKEQRTREVYPYYCFRCPTCGWQSPYWGTGKCINGHDIEGTDFEINIYDISTPKSECTRYDSIKYLCVYNGQNWFYWDDGSSPDLQTVKTQYSYRTRSTYQYPVQEEWSSWGDNEIIPADDLSVETRMLYSYQDRIK